jgi:LmbE family N-acetylglucosaminyl deacetylase
MCVVAHPDDECFAFGGALALAADRGIETSVICFTDGQAATHRGSAESGSELGETRRREFADSCDVLGVTEHEVLGYHDAQLQKVPLLEATEHLVRRMRRFRPDVVITFGSDGGLNSHIDHMMVSFWTTTAFQWAGRSNRFPEITSVFQPRRLFHLSTDAFLPDRQAPMPSPWTAALDISRVRERKSGAFEKHVSQAPLMERTKPFFAEHGGKEFYTLVAEKEPHAAKLLTELFEDLA